MSPNISTGDTLNMRNVFKKIPRRQGDVAEEGQWRRVRCRTSPSVHHCTVGPPTPSVRGRDVVHGKVKGCGRLLLESLRGARSHAGQGPRRAFILNGDRGVVHGKVKGGGKQLDIRRHAAA